MKMPVALLIVMALAALVAVAGCASGTAPVPGPAATSPARGTPATVGADKWQQTLEAAKKEGTVTIYGELGSEAKNGLTEAFQKRYGIELQTVIGTGPDVASRYIQETSRNINLADVVFNGDMTFLNVIKPNNVLAPVEPYLMLPEIKDPRVWPEGKIPYLDKDHLVIESTIGRNFFGIFNTEMVREGEINSFQDYLNPRWKGQIVMWDPTIAGASSAMVSFLLTKVYGPDEGQKYLRQLAQQEPVMVRDKRLPVEWVAKGKYPIHLGPNMQMSAEFRKAGAPIKATQEKEGFLMHPSSSCFALAAKPPHPNAAIVLVNWLLTSEAGAILSQAWSAPSSRLDVPTTGIDPMRLPVAGIKMYFDDEELVMQNPKSQDVSRSIFASLIK